MSEYVYDMGDYRDPIREKIVRCMDCIYFDNDTNHGAHCWKFGNALWDDYDGYCAWGERRSEA